MKKVPETKRENKHLNVRLAVLRWIDSDWDTDGQTGSGIDWVRVLPFLLLDVACLLVFVVVWSWTAVAVAAGLYFVRMFAITGFYHRYFSHGTNNGDRIP